MARTDSSCRVGTRTLSRRVSIASSPIRNSERKWEQPPENEANISRWTAWSTKPKNYIGAKPASHKPIPNDGHSLSKLDPDRSRKRGETPGSSLRTLAPYLAGSPLSGHPRHPRLHLVRRPSVGTREHRDRYGQLLRSLACGSRLRGR